VLTAINIQHRRVPDSARRSHQSAKLAIGPKRPSTLSAETEVDVVAANAAQE